MQTIPFVSETNSLPNTINGLPNEQVAQLNKQVYLPKEQVTHLNEQVAQLKQQVKLPNKQISQLKEQVGLHNKQIDHLNEQVCLLNEQVGLPKENNCIYVETLHQSFTVKKGKSLIMGTRVITGKFAAYTQFFIFFKKTSFFLHWRITFFCALSIPHTGIVFLNSVVLFCYR